MGFNSKRKILPSMQQSLITTPATVLKHVYCKLHITELACQIVIAGPFYHPQSLTKSILALQCVLKSRFKHCNHPNCDNRLLQFN